MKVDGGGGFLAQAGSLVPPNTEVRSGLSSVVDLSLSPRIRAGIKSARLRTQPPHGLAAS